LPRYLKGFTGTGQARYGGEVSDFGETTEPIARKIHRCEWCAGPIPKGEKHKQFKGMWEGEWQSWKMHNECYEDASKNDAMQEGFTPGDGEMPERVRNLVGERG
jgi:hypothetical protein